MSTPFTDIESRQHVELDHPVVVCWDCDGIVVEKNSLELHYTESSAHPSCTFCGVGKKNSADMDVVCVIAELLWYTRFLHPTQHIRHVHATDAEMQDQPSAGNVNVGTR